MKIGINVKLVILAVLLVAIPCIILGVVGYKASQTAIYQGVNDRLEDQAKDWKLLSQAYNEEIVAQEIRVKKSAENIVTAETKMTYELIEKALKDNGGQLPENVKQDILNRLSRNTVGKSGYIWVLDYQGNYILSKGRARDGENIWNTKDSNGNMVIQDLVSKGRAATGSEIVLHSYPWLNNGETEPREKIAAMLHFPELGWVVGVSTYYDDLVDMTYRVRTMDHVKDLISKQVIGLTGYIWVLDSAGKYVVSKDRLRDGEDINNAKDTNGVLFIQEMIKKAKAAGEGVDHHAYPWLNKGEKTARMKVAGLSYMKDWDWVIGVSAYYDDFQGAGSLGTVKQTLFIVGFLAILLGALIAFFAANKISSPLKKMTEAGRKIADGDLNADIPVVKTGDEVEELGITMSMLVGAIKYLRGSQKK